MNVATVIAPKQSVTNTQAIFWGGLVAGVLDAVDGVIAYGTQGLNPIQVLQYIASGALGQSAFEGGLATAALGAAFHFAIVWAAPVRDFENTCFARRTALRRRSLLLHDLPGASAIGCGRQHFPSRSFS